MITIPRLFNLLLACLIAAMLSSAVYANTQAKHGISMYGDPALPPDFTALPYANPNAPKGGRLIMSEAGGFDSLNPHIRKGTVPWQLRFLAYESLMGRSWAEPFALYGLLAESVKTPPDRSWVEFTLRKEAKFSDGTPVRVEDVMWSYETLGTIGHPRYHGFWKKVKKMEQTGPLSFKLTFTEKNRELALIAGLRPILKKAQWDGINMVDAPLNMIPISTAPYVITDFDPGISVTLGRNKTYWGNDLPFRRGTHNIDEIRVEFYADATVIFEAFKAGKSDVYRETNAHKWQNEYTFPAIENGRIVKSEIPHARPSGMSGFVMNTRLDKFKDWRVRDALIHAFNFEYINKVITNSKADRITSYFSNSALGARPGPATGRVKSLLSPHRADLLPGALEGYALPASDGTKSNRKNIRRALQLMEQAGWRVANDGIMRNAGGDAFEFEILLKQGVVENSTIADLYQQALKRLGIQVTITQVDTAQYKQRTNIYDFDMIYYKLGLSLSPGNEQWLYWGADGITTPGTRNLMGVSSPAIKAMLTKLLNSENRHDFITAARAFDRVITTGRYAIPFYQFKISRIAHSSKLHYPAQLPIYGDWIGFLPDIWWIEN